MNTDTNRRSFLLASSGVLGSLALFALPSRADTAVGPQCPPPALPPQILNQINRNHGHALTLTYEEVIKGEPKTYSIQGSSGHPHELALTEEHFEALRKVETIEVESSLVAGHTHIVRITREKIPVAP